jgi:hypothetical protein
VSSREIENEEMDDVQVAAKASRMQRESIHATEDVRVGIVSKSQQSNDFNLARITCRMQRRFPIDALAVNINDRGIQDRRYLLHVTTASGREKARDGGPHVHAQNIRLRLCDPIL